MNFYINRPQKIHTGPQGRSDLQHLQGMAFLVDVVF